MKTAQMFGYSRGISLIGKRVRDFYRRKRIFKDSWRIPLKTKEFSRKVYEIFGSGMPLIVVPQGDLFATKRHLQNCIMGYKTPQLYPYGGKFKYC